MKKLIALYISAVVGTAAGYFLMASVFIITEELQIDLPQGTCKDAVLIPLMLGVPTGGPLAMALMERLVYKTSSRWLEAVGISMFFTLPGIIAGICFMDLYGSMALILIPFTTPILSAPAYYLTCRKFRAAENSTVGS